MNEANNITAQANTGNCIMCGTQFVYERKNRMKYCSNACKCAAYQSRRARIRTTERFHEISAELNPRRNPEMVPSEPRYGQKGYVEKYPQGKKVYSLLADDRELDDEDYRYQMLDVMTSVSNEKIDPGSPEGLYLVIKRLARQVKSLQSLPRSKPSSEYQFLNQTAYETHLHAKAAIEQTKEVMAMLQAQIKENDRLQEEVRLLNKRVNSGVNEMIGNIGAAFISNMKK